MNETSKEENKRVSAIKELLEREGLKQKDLANIIDIEPQNLSRCLISGKVSEKMCRKIAKHFPQYQIEWLLGDDDYATKTDKLLVTINQQREEGNLLDKGFFSYLELYGYEVTEGSFDDSGNPLSNAIREAHRGVTISRDGKSVTLPLFPLIDFQNEIGEYIELRLKHMMK